MGQEKTVFIDAALEDVELASQMRKALQADQVPYLPLIDFSSRPTTISKSLERNLRECDVVILINDRVPQTWVNDRLRYYSRTFMRRRQPIEKVIVYRPTQDKRSFKDFVLPDKTKIEECSSTQECLSLILDQ